MPTIFADISEPLRTNGRSLASFPDYELATRRRLRSGTADMAVTKSEVEITHERKELAKRFPSATHTFSTMPDSNISLPTRPDIGNSEWRKINLMSKYPWNGKSWRSDFHRCPHIFDHPQLRYGSADKIRQEDLKMVHNKPKVEINLERKELALAERLQRLPLNFCHARLSYGMFLTGPTWIRQCLHRLTLFGYRLKIRATKSEVKITSEL